MNAVFPQRVDELNKVQWGKEDPAYPSYTAIQFVAVKYALSRYDNYLEWELVY